MLYYTMTVLHSTILSSTILRYTMLHYTIRLGIQDRKTPVTSLGLHQVALFEELPHLQAELRSSPGFWGASNNRVPLKRELEGSVLGDIDIQLLCRGYRYGVHIDVDMDVDPDMTLLGKLASFSKGVRWLF